MAGRIGSLFHGGEQVQVNIIPSVDPALAPWLIGYVGSEVKTGDKTLRRVIPARPNCFVQIILEGGHSMIDVDSGKHIAAPVAGLFGPLTHYRYDMEIKGHLKTFSIRLQPAAAAQLFGLDPVRLIDNFVPFRLSSGLLDQLRHQDGWETMALLADGWLARQTRGRRGDDPVALSAIRIREACGRESVQTVAEHTGLSLRQFQRRFQALTGLNPKQYARICRIGHAVYRKELDPDVSWTTLAAECGYTDQSHFIRDFKALTGGELPRRFLREQTPILRTPEWGS